MRILLSLLLVLVPLVLSTLQDIGLSGSCVDNDGNRRENGQQWTNETWTCKNGWPKVIYCDDSVLGRLEYMRERKSSLPWRNLSRCEETGVVPVYGSVINKDCKDQQGVARQHGESWTIQDTKVVWQCLSGYPRPSNCTYIVNPQLSIPLEYGATVDIFGISHTCDVDGLIPNVFETTKMEPETTTYSTEQPTTVPTTTYTTERITTPYITGPPTTTVYKGKGVCIDNDGAYKRNGDQWKNETTGAVWICKNGWSKVIYCEDSVLGRVSYSQGKGQTGVRNMSRCFETGLLEDGSPVVIHDCKDYAGIARQHGETWTSPESLVVWQCISGYPRPINCTYFVIPQFSIFVHYMATLKNTNQVCDVDGLVSIESEPTITKPETTTYRTEQPTTTTAYTTEQTTFPYITWPPATTAYPEQRSCVDDDGFFRSNGETWTTTGLLPANLIIGTFALNTTCTWTRNYGTNELTGCGFPRMNVNVSVGRGIYINNSVHRCTKNGWIVE